jgi:hypothetical protein
LVILLFFEKKEKINETKQRKERRRRNLNGANQKQNDFKIHKLNIFFAFIVVTTMFRSSLRDLFAVVFWSIFFCPVYRLFLPRCCAPEERQFRARTKMFFWPVWLGDHLEIERLVSV